MHLNLSEKKQLLKQIDFLSWCCDRAESLQQQSIDELNQLFPEIIGFLPIHISHLNNPSYLIERITINEDVDEEKKNRRLLNLKQLRYPPREIKDKLDYNRGTLKGQVGFYAGNKGVLPLAIETKPKKGQMITKSIWKLNANVTLNLFVICQSLEIVSANPKELADDFNHYYTTIQKLSPNTREVVEAVYKLIVKSFTKEVNSRNKQGYLLSALFSDFLLYRSGYHIDAIMYPSVPNEGAAMNFVINPDVLDTSFTMIEAIESIIVSHPTSKVNGWHSVGTGNCQNYDRKTLELNWISTSYPPDHEVNKIIKEYNVII